MPYGMEYPCVQLGSAVPAVSPPSFWHRPSLIAGGSGGANRERLDAEPELFSNSSNTGVLTALFWSQIKNRVLNWLLQRKLTPTQPDSELFS